MKRSRSTEPSPNNTHDSTEALYVVRKCSARSRDIETCYIVCIYGHEGTVNSSFGAEDGLQQLQTVVETQRKKAPAFAKLPELTVN